MDSATRYQALDSAAVRESDFDVASPTVFVCLRLVVGSLAHQIGDNLRLPLGPAFLLVAAVWAQQQTPPSGNLPQRPPISPQEVPEATESQPPPAEYGGPAILSRGGSATVKTFEMLRLRPYLNLHAVYDSNLATVSIDQQGQVPFTSAYGMEASFGVTGRHAWKKTELDLDYRAAFRHYNKKTFYDGMDNSLTLSVRHQASRRVRFVLEEDAARYQRSYFLPAGLGTGYDSMLSGLTGNEMFDTPTNMLLSTGRLIYERTARLSFSASGSGFFVRRRSESLVGANGWIATGDVAYRLSRYQTLGVDYSFNHFDFTHQFGAADLHGVSLNYAVRLSRRWEFALRVGGYRAETQQLQQVRLDPVIAAIFGQYYGIQVFHRILYLPRYEAHLTRGYRRGNWSLGYSRTLMPGNGVYLTSAQETAQMQSSYNGLRKVSLQGSVVYNSYSSVAQTIGKYRSYGAGGGASVKLTRVMSVIARMDARRYVVANSSLQRTPYRATLGLAWSPGDYPLAIW